MIGKTATMPTGGVRVPDTRWALLGDAYIAYQVWGSGPIGGRSVHTAARVQALAKPSEVVVSRTVVDLVAGSGIDFEERSKHQLRASPGTGNSSRSVMRDVWSARQRVVRTTPTERS